MNRQAQFTKLYAEVPKVHCKGLCQSNCSIVQCSTWESKRINMESEPLEVADPYQCPFLSSEGLCNVYDVRPLGCRLYGAADGLECPHGCQIEGSHLTRKEGYALIERSLNIGQGEACLNSMDALERILSTLPSEAQNVDQVRISDLK